MVNGAPRWTCRTLVTKVAKRGTLRVGPLRNLPVLRDLVTDMEPFFAKMDGAGAAFQAPPAVEHAKTMAPRSRMDRIVPGSKQRTEIDRTIECIGCAVCYAACDTVANEPEFLGPAALNRVWTLINDVRDNGTHRQEALLQRGGCTLCHTQQSCSNLCPQQLSPSRSICRTEKIADRPS